MVSPFFYKDIHDVSTTDEMTFYVQPALTETTIENWIDWAVIYVPVDTNISNGELSERHPQSSRRLPNAGPGAPVEIDTDQSIYSIQNSTDWLTSPATTVLYGGTLVGQYGGINTDTQPPEVSVGTVGAQAATRTAAANRIVVTPRGIASRQAHALKRVNPAASARNSKK